MDCENIPQNWTPALRAIRGQVRPLAILLALTGLLSGLALVSPVGARAAAGKVTWGLAVQGNWSFLDEPGAARLFSATGYGATMVRDIVPYCQSATNCAQALRQIQADVSHVGQTRLFITLECVSDAPCGTKGQTETNLKATLPQLMATFPHILYWSAQNEPAGAGKPTTGNPLLASKLWLDAAAIAQSSPIPGPGLWLEAPASAQNPPGDGAPGGARVIVAGEGWGGSYTRRYASSIAAGLSHRPGLNAPTTWSVHSYDDVVCAQTKMTTAFRDQVLAVPGVGAAMRHIWLSEEGVHLASPQQKTSSSLCQNGKDMLSSNAALAARAQIRAADTFLALPAVDQRIDHVFYYSPDPASPQGWGGGLWDSSLYTPMAAQRPTYAVLVDHQNPDPGSYSLSALLPPSEWQSPSGQTSISGQASAASVSQGRPVTLSVRVAQGSVAPGQPLPMPSGQIHFYEATHDWGWVQLDPGAAASTTLTLPPGSHTVVADLNDPIYKLQSPYSATITVH